MTDLLPIRDLQRSRLFCFKLFLLLLAIVRYYNGIRERTYLTRSAILPPHLAPWRHLMDNGDPSSFLLMTGLTREAFNILLDIIKPPGHPALPKGKGVFYIYGQFWSVSPNGQRQMAYIIYLIEVSSNKYKKATSFKLILYIQWDIFLLMSVYVEMGYIIVFYYKCELIKIRRHKNI